jgi:hypothetical protein
MDDEDSYKRGLKIFFQLVNEQIKKNPDYQVDDLENEIIKWAKECGFRPRKFLEYYKTHEQDKDDSGPASDI